MFALKNFPYTQKYKRKKDRWDRIKGFLLMVFLILAIPLVSLFLDKQTESQTQASPSTSLIVSSPVTSTHVGDRISVAVTLIPYKTTVSLIKLVLAYDKTALSIAEPFSINILDFPVTLVSPDYTHCTGDTCYVSLTISTGDSLQNAITQRTAVGTILFTALSPTPQTRIVVDNATQVLSEKNGTNILTKTTPFILAIAKTTQSTKATQSNCYYQTVCLSCPVKGSVRALVAAKNLFV